MTQAKLTHEQLKTALKKLREEQAKTDVRLTSEFEDILSQVADEIRRDETLRSDWDKFFLETSAEIDQNCSTKNRESYVLSVFLPFNSSK